MLMILSCTYVGVCQNLSFDAHIKQVSRTALFYFVILSKVGTSCLRVRQFMHLLLQDWTTVILYY